MWFERGLLGRVVFNRALLGRVRAVLERGLLGRVRAVLERGLLGRVRAVLERGQLGRVSMCAVLLVLVFLVLVIVWRCMGDGGRWEGGRV